MIHEAPRSRSSSALLALPDVLLHDILSWSPDSATANALFATCRVAHCLRRDPAAAALLLLRHPCRCHDTALISCAEDGGELAVMLQVLQLMQATQDGGGPIPAPAPLLQAMLFCASSKGANAVVHSLLALPHPPDVNANDGRALRWALVHGPQEATLRALLEAGADPCQHPRLELFSLAAGASKGLPALSLLLRHCPAARIAEATRVALRQAVATLQPRVVQWLLLRAGGAAALFPGDIPALLSVCARVGAAEVLQLLLDHLPSLPPEALHASLALALERGHADCATLLLDRGAVADTDDDTPLCAAVVVNGPGGWGGVPPLRRAARLGLLRLLLHRCGVVVTPRVWAAARTKGCAQVVGLLQAAAPAAPAGVAAHAGTGLAGAGVLG